MPSSSLFPAAAAGLALALAACGGAARTAVAPSPAQPPAPLASATTAAVHPWTEADVRFMSMMVGHHAQAIEMSRLAPQRASSAAVKRLAERIINAQQDEIGTIQQWLRDRGQSVPDAAHAGMHHGGHHAMPGMLTAEQMQQLERATGAEFDRLFLQRMIQHHRGAVDMVTELFGSHGAGQDETVFKFASDVNVDQTTEINRMRQMLAELTFGTTSP